MISKIPMKLISSKEIFQSKNEQDLIQNGTDLNMQQKNKSDTAVALSLLMDNYESNMKLKNPEFNDISNPEVEFKDVKFYFLFFILFVK